MTTMSAVQPTAQAKYIEDLIAHGHFIPSGEPGIYGRGMIFEQVRNGFSALVSRVSTPDRAETPRFPPVIPRRTLEKAGYLGSFPQLCGVVYSFAGKDADAIDIAERASAGEDWTHHLSPTGVTMVPAACYPSYPAIAQRGPLPEAGVTLDLGDCYVFRNEPSGDPARLQMFHQRELVRIGHPEEVEAWREMWIARARRIFELCRLDVTIAPASDPFFGRKGKLLANNQRELGLKYEAVVPIATPGGTAVSSFNLHHEHFGAAFGIQLHNGATAHSSCVGFGLERITLALFRAHGLDLRDWPRDVLRHICPALSDA
ncbi:MAG TPA: amino acid--[acyl-carrier-protein] ligase [Bryobacteraceae bacterium]|nr:amino acid--[acyl-carrier-protein] ligase [Bryobacteraceae bacterium]